MAVVWAKDLLDKIEREEREGIVLQFSHLSQELRDEIESRRTLSIFYERGLENLKAYLGSIA